MTQIQDFSGRIHLDGDIVVRAGVNATGFSITGELRWTQATLNEHLEQGVQQRAPKPPLRVNAYVGTNGKT
ncbi:hypothetical protein ACFSYH_10470 [Populibacterium corticicola]|uniref:Uncharacterized protein n=1 Tax=Populibacterium corticicola TaxID=1812826 RepID=A0ABW5XF69_9MICO